jgi:hypothetical protein
MVIGIRPDRQGKQLIGNGDAGVFQILPGKITSEFGIMLPQLFFCHRRRGNVRNGVGMLVNL